MTITPDPLDVLKYAVLHTSEMLSFAADEAGQHEADAAADVCLSLCQELRNLLSPFVTTREDAHTYSDGSRVFTPLSGRPGVTRIVFHRPPGVPNQIGAPA